MVEEEEKAAAAKAASERFGADGQVQDVHKKGQWFSNPQGGVQQLTGGANVQGVAGAHSAPLALAAGANGADAQAGKPAKAVKEDVSEFDAW